MALVCARWLRCTALPLGLALLAAAATAAATDTDMTAAKELFQSAAKKLAAQQYSQALANMNKALEIAPDFVTGYLSRARIRLRRGDLEGAAQDYHHVLRLQRHHDEAAQATAGGKLANMAHAVNAGNIAYRSMNWHQVILYLKDVAPEISYNSTLQYMLTRALFETGQFQEAFLASGHILKAHPHNVDGLLLRGQILYQIGEDQAALENYRHGLRLDQGHKELRKVYKPLLKILKVLDRVKKEIQDRKFGEAVESYRMAVDMEKRDFALKNLLLELCRMETKASMFEAAIKSCTRAIEMDDSVVEAWTARGEAYLLSEKYQEAVRDYTTASQKSPENRDIRISLHNAQLELKKSKRKNYYKILGVPKNAHSSAIRKAYRHLVRQYHPDMHVGKSSEEIEAASAMFRDATEASEVLLDSDKRGRYDRGEDLDDNKQQHFHRSSHFAFNGGGFAFRFG